MKTVSVHASRSYEIRIGRGLLQGAGEQIRAVTDAKKVMLVSDDAVWPLYGDAVRRSLETAGLTVCSFVFPHGESSKCACTYLELLDALCAQQLTRKDAIAALGGGVAGDLAGFAASTYLRGIGFIQIPTTLLAMVDSSVGGKTAIDLPAGKNLAGTFYQPWLVLCDPDCLTTLPEEIFHDGCAEVIKYAVLGNAPFFDDLRAGSAHAQLEHIIETCVTMKRDIVAQDEFDRGQRQLLNMGKQISPDFRHAAAAFGLCTEKTRDTVVDILRQYDLPVDCAFRAEDMLPTILHDKKAAGDTINLIVPTAVGQCQIVKTPASEIMDWLRAGGVR